MQKETSRQATTAAKVAQDAKTASDAATKAVNAQQATVNDTNDMARLTHFRRTRVFIYERKTDSDSVTGVKILWDDRTTALTFDADSSGMVIHVDGSWEGYLKTTIMSADSKLGITVEDVLGWSAKDIRLNENYQNSWAERYVFEIFPLWPDKATKNRFYQRGLAGLK